MAFTYLIKFDAEGLGPSAPSSARVTRWMAPMKSVLPAGTSLLRLASGGASFELRTTFPCMLAERGAAQGADLVPGALIARVYAEGEDLPYGRSYCTLHPADDAAA